MGEQHLNLLPAMARALVGRRVCQASGDITSIFVEVTWHFALRCVRTALRLEGTALAIRLARSVEPRPILGDTRARRRVGPPELHQQLALRAGVVIALSIEDEVRSREGAVGPIGLVEHRNVRLDLSLLDQLSRRRCRRQGAGAEGRSVWRFGRSWSARPRPRPGGWLGSPRRRG